MLDQTGALMMPAVLDGQMQVGDALRRLELFADQQMTVIRRVMGGRIYWYLKHTEDVRAELAGKAGDARLIAVLELPEWNAIPARSWQELQTEGFQPQIILDGDRVLGLYWPPEPMVGAKPGGEDGPPPEAGPPAETDPPGDEGAPGDEAVPVLGRPPRGRAPAPPMAPAPPTAPAPAPGPAPGPSKPTEPFKAFPSLQAPEEVQVGEWFDLSVGLARKQVQGVHGRSLEIAVPREVEQFPLEVRLMARGFESRDGWTQTLTVNRADPGASEVCFTLKPLEQEEELDLRSLRVHFFYEGQYCGGAYRNLTVYRPDAQTTPPDDVSTPWAGRAGGAVSLPVGEAAVDITLIIDRAGGATNGDQFECMVTTPHPVGALPEGPLAVQLQEGRNAASFAAEVADQVQKAMANPLLRFTLEGLGKVIAGHLPPPVWDVVHKVCEHVRQTEGREATLLIHSEECYIPWELAYFKLDPERPPYLGAQVAMGRWYQPEASAAAESLQDQIDVNGMTVIWSEYEGVMGQARLPHAKEEANFLGEQFAAAKLPARLPEIGALLDGSAAAEVLHFACHGTTYPLTPGSAELVLESGPPNLSPIHILGSADSFKQGRPFVFLNACQVGQAVNLLTSNVGFAGAFLQVGCRGCIAPLWNIVDETAGSIVREFYQRTMAEGLTVGQVLRELRAKFLASGSPDPTYLAYVYYGHPNLKLKQKAV